MLSYDTPVSMNGQSPSSPTLSNGHQSVPASPKAMRLPPSTTSNGVNGVNAVNGAGHATAEPAEHRHIWLVTGPAGCGKSTVAKHLAATLTLPYIEGDEYHPNPNIEKMTHGIPLTDADRWDWLTILREEAIKELVAGSKGVVVTCSALKRKYRDVIRVAPYFAPNLHLHFIYLSADEQLLLKRVSARQDHYMGSNMVHSQFEALQPPAPDEIDIISIDSSRSADEVKALALDRVLKTMAEVKSQ